VKERKGEIAALDKAAFRLRQLLRGKEVEQGEIPGAEIPSVKPRKSGTITEITLKAGGREVKTTPEQLRAGLDELKRRKRSTGAIDSRSAELERERREP
jgi:hypothetical protein